MFSNMVLDLTEFYPIVNHKEWVLSKSLSTRCILKEKTHNYLHIFSITL